MVQKLTISKRRKKITKRRLQRSTDKVTFVYITMDFPCGILQKEKKISWEITQSRDQEVEYSS